MGENDTAEQLWWSELPEPVRVEVLRLLARMIARGVVVDTDADGDRAGRLG